MPQYALGAGGCRRTANVTHKHTGRKDHAGKRIGGVRARSYGAFSRALALPAEIDENKVDASFAKGVLKITIAKKPEGKSATRKIEISAD